MWQGVTKFFSQNMYLSNSTPATIILFLEYTLYSYNEMKYGPGLQWYNSKDPKLLIGFTANSLDWHKELLGEMIPIYSIFKTWS